LSTIAFAIPFWQPIASSVTVAPRSDRSAKSFGMAVFSFDFTREIDPIK
jgi:hypothetical protein